MNKFTISSFALAVSLVFKVEIEKCDKFAGNTKDQCVARAKTQFGK
ncbi:MAG: hypothetical protein ACYCTY_04105 [Sulfuricella sp.]